MLSWQLLITLFLFLSTASVLLRRYLATTLAAHNQIINAVFYVGILYPLALLVTALSPAPIHISGLNLLLLFIGEWLFPFSLVLSFRASRQIDAGSYTIIGNLTPIVTIITAWTLLNEGLSGYKFIGAVIIILSAFIVTLPKLRAHKIDKNSGLMLALVASILLGLAITFERFMLTRMNLESYLVFGWGFQTLWMVLIAWPKRRELSILRDRKKLYYIVGYGLSFALGGLCFVSALKLSGNVSVISSIISFRTVLVVLAALIFLREKEWLWLKIGAALVGTAGLIILSRS